MHGRCDKLSKALTVAIAGALAVPMAAHAVDVTLSGHVARALVITDSDGMSSTSANVKNFGSSGSRIRVKGTGEMMDGGSTGVLLEYGAGSSLSLRYADLWFSGGFGKVSIGLGDQGGEGSVYNDKSGVLGIGHGQEAGSASVGNYYKSLDGGGPRVERIRYDTPSVGPFSAAISLGTHDGMDKVSAGLKLNQEFGGTSFSAGIGALQIGGTDKSILSGSAGVKLASGVTISGAWGTGESFMGALDMGKTLVEKQEEVSRILRYKVNPAGNYNPVEGATARNLGEALALIQPAVQENQATGVVAYDALGLTNLVERWTDMDASNENKPLEDGSELSEMQMMGVMAVLERGHADCAQDDKPGTPTVTECSQLINLGKYVEMEEVTEVRTDDYQHMTDPSFFQTTIGYVFGDTSVGVSWYQSSDLHREGSELTVVGAAVNHNLPKLNANVYAAVQNFSVEDGDYQDTDESVVMIGARVKF